LRLIELVGEEFEERDSLIIRPRERKTQHWCLIISGSGYGDSGEGIRHFLKIRKKKEFIK
jgi:hypothetical protein